MTIKVGDMVRITTDDYPVNAPRGSCREVSFISDSRLIAVIGDDGYNYNLLVGEYEPLTSHTPTILTTITDRMEQHMAAGQYVQAVRWARVAEMVRELEDE